MKDVYAVCLIVFAMMGPLGAIWYEKKTEKDAIKNGRETIEKEMINNAAIAGITVLPLFITVLSFVVYEIYFSIIR